MPIVSSCPKCQKPVSVPNAIDSAALVRCPLCAAEYPLGEALPPELIPVLVAASPAPAAKAVEGSVKLEETIEHEPVVEGREEEEAKSTPEHKEIAIEHEEDEAAAVAVGQTRLGTMAAVRGRRPPPASGLKRAIEVVSGGLAGCLVAYYGLALCLGPEFKNLGFPDLPGVVWLTTAPAKPDASGEKPAEDSSAQAKPGNGKTSLEAPDAGKTPGSKAPPAPPAPPKAGVKPSPSGTSAKAP